MTLSTASEKLNRQLDKACELGEVISDKVLGETRHIKVKSGDTLYALDQHDPDSFSIAMCWEDSSGIGYEYGQYSKTGKTLRTAKTFIAQRA